MKNILSFLFVLIAACSAEERSRQATNEFLPGEKLAQLKNENLREISGIAASIEYPKHFWVHNDAGNKPIIYLLDENLDVKLTCELEGVENRDWEDIAVGPGPDSAKNYIYVGDIGDNDGKHKYKHVYRLEEPVSKDGETNVTVTAVDKITFSLDDGPKDTETLLLEPLTKNLYVVSKREQPVYLYELKYPYAINEPHTAKQLLSLPMTAIVGGDFAPDGTEILLKSYNDVMYWRSTSQGSISETLKASAVRLPYQKEPQGEAITWARDGSGYYTLSEEIKNEDVYLYFYKRK
jgi:hypothetical protein